MINKKHKQTNLENLISNENINSAGDPRALIFVSGLYLPIFIVGAAGFSYKMLDHIIQNQGFSFNENFPYAFASLLFGIGVYTSCNLLHKGINDYKKRKRNNSR